MAAPFFMYIAYLAFAIKYSFEADVSPTLQLYDGVWQNRIRVCTGFNLDYCV